MDNLLQKINTLNARFAVLGICLLVLVGLDTLKGWEVVRFGDAPDYIDAANALKAGRHYPHQGTLSFFRPPLYPMLIATVWSVFPTKIFVLKIVQIVLHLLTVWFVMKTANVFKLNGLQIVFAGLFYGLDPFTMQNVTDIQTEPLQAFLTTAALFGFFCFFSNEHKPKIQAVSLACSAWIMGLASLCRPSALAIGLSCGVPVCLLLYHKRSDLMKFARLSVLYYVAFFAAIIPWSIYNRYNLGEWILITDGGGYHLWLGNHLDNLKIHEGSFNNTNTFSDFAFTKLQQENVQRLTSKWEEEYGYSTLSLKERENLWKKEFIANLNSSPKNDVLRLLFYKMLAFWRPWLNSNAYSTKMVVVSLIINGTKYLLCIIGLRRFLNSPSQTTRYSAIFILFFFAAATVPHIITHSMMRFRIPYAEPVIDLLAGATFAGLLLPRILAAFGIKQESDPTHSLQSS